MGSWRESTGRFRYRHSPLVEALCEFGFAPMSAWNPDLISGLQAAFRGGYPVRKDLKTIQTQVEFNPQGVRHGMHQGERIQFVKEDGTSMVQVAPNTLTINNLKPYSGWDAFRHSILNSLSTYQEVTKPTILLRSHLRYINRIELDGPEIELDDWFHFSFRQPDVKGLPGAAAYLVGANYSFGEHATLRFQLASAPSNNGNALAAMFDLEYISIGENVLSINDVGAWLEEAHNRIESAWLGAISEQLHLRCEPESIP